MGDVRDPATDQVAPTPNDGVAIQDLLIEDVKKRKDHGIAKYGTPVQAHNGRRMILDAYEEVLDLAVYLRGALEEGLDFTTSETITNRIRVFDADANLLYEGSDIDCTMKILPNHRIQRKTLRYSETYKWVDVDAVQIET